MENHNNSKDIVRNNLELQLGEQLNALISASHALNVRTAECFDANIQPAAFLIIRWLFSFGPTSATALAEATAMDRSSVSRLINQLKAMNYIKSEPSPEDKRSTLVSLTEIGKQRTMEALKEKESDFYKRIIEWDNSRLESFIDLLRDFNGYDNK